MRGFVDFLAYFWIYWFQIGRRSTLATGHSSGVAVRSRNEGRVLPTSDHGKERRNNEECEIELVESVRYDGNLFVAPPAVAAGAGQGLEGWNVLRHNPA